MLPNNAPTANFAVVTPNDSTDLPRFARALYVGGGGDLVIIGVDGTTATTFKNVAAGGCYPLCARRALATGTTATGIVALF